MLSLEDAVSAPCVFVGLPDVTAIKILIWMIRHQSPIRIIGKWVIYFVIYFVVFALLWNLFLGFRGPNGRDDD